MHVNSGSSAAGQIQGWMLETPLVMFDEIIRNLEQWSKEQQLVELAIESCKVAMNNCAVEEAELFPSMNTGVDVLRGLSLHEIELHLEKQSLVFHNANLSYPYIDTNIGLYVSDPNNFWHRNLKPVGHYRLITKLDGEVDDDYLVLDKELEESQ